MLSDEGEAGGQRTFKLKTRLQSQDTKISSSQCAEHVSTTTSRTSSALACRTKVQETPDHLRKRNLVTAASKTSNDGKTTPDPLRTTSFHCTCTTAGPSSVRSSLPGVNALPEGSMSTQRRERKKKRPRGNRQKSVVCHDGHTERVRPTSYSAGTV